MSVVPLAEVKSHLQFLGSANDTELQRFIDAAEAAIAHRTGPLAPTTVTNERLSGGGSVLVLNNPRVVSLTSVSYSDGTTTTLGDFDLDTQTGILGWGPNTAGYFTAGTRNVLVSYVAGFSTLPEDLRHAVKELVRHLWETQRPNSAGRPGFTDEPPVVGSFSSWPIRVQEMVQPYAMPSGVA